MERIRYKYRKAKEGIKLGEIRCPVCKSKHINWTMPVQDISWNGRVVLLAECWFGSADFGFEKKPRHLFLIEIEDLPIVNVSKIKNEANNIKKRI